MVKEIDDDKRQPSLEEPHERGDAKPEIARVGRRLLKRELVEKVASLEGEVSRLRQESEKAQNTLQQETDRLLRALAQERNLRNRAAAEETLRLHSLKEQILSSFLPLLDDFERAVASEAHNPDSLRQGVEIILRQLREAVAAHGVVEMTCLGQPFDPNFHEAVGTIATSDLPEGTVAAVERKGYLLDGRTLRPAEVTVAAKPKEEAEAETAQ